MADGLVTHIINLGLIRHVSRIDAFSDRLYWVQSLNELDRCVVKYDIKSRIVRIAIKRNYTSLRNGTCLNSLQKLSAKLPNSLSMFEVFRRCIVFLRLAVKTYEREVEEYWQEAPDTRNTSDTSLLAYAHRHLCKSKNANKKSTPLQLQLRKILTERNLLDRINPNQRWWKQPSENLYANLMSYSDEKLLHIAKGGLWTTKNALKKQPTEYQLILRRCLTERGLLSAMSRKRRWWADNPPSIEPAVVMRSESDKQRIVFETKGSK